MKKSNIKTLKKRADAAFSLYIRYRDSKDFLGERKTECITCGIWKPIKEMQNGHFVSRTCSKLRYSDTNCNSQCMPCNVMKHGDLYQYAKKLDLKHGNGTADRLHNQRTEYFKLTEEFLQKVIDDSKEYIKEMEG
jgi:hypothetical protein